ncbi:MAG: ATP-dependent Clp protease adaptor ClpS [Candidatus Aminicenantes bacterium]|nr:MAG: ATP-dependent Clp protease adaptor ClpS [Candidatus Aminicenantes bacterium]
MGKGTELSEVLPGSVKTAPDIKVKKPKMYWVILHNDDYTSMEFVVNILIAIFDKVAAEATKIMLDVHNKGKGVCGAYTYDIAVTKIKQVHAEAQKEGFPLRCSFEEA